MTPYLSAVNGTHYSPFSPSVAAGAIVVNRSSVAALAFIVWDILITLDDEIALIWAQPWSFAKFHYFFVRYIPTIVQIPLLLVGSELTPHFHFTRRACYIWQIYQGIAVLLVDVSVGWILVLRVDALYHHNFIIHRLIRLLYVCAGVGMVVGLVLALPRLEFDSLCIVVNSPRILMVFGASSISFELFLFVLTLHKFMQAIKSGWGDVLLLKLLMRDGTWAFFLVALCYFVQTCLFLSNISSYSGLLYGWLLSVPSFCGYRILLNLRGFGNPTDETLPGVMGSIHFRL